MIAREQGPVLHSHRSFSIRGGDKITKHDLYFGCGMAGHQSQEMWRNIGPLVRPYDCKRDTLVYLNHGALACEVSA
jgi:hypothetical protein